MDKKTLGLGLIPIGLAWVMVSLGADAIGLGAAPGIGWKQWLSTAAGVVIVLVGMWFLWRAASEPSSMLSGTAPHSVPSGTAPHSILSGTSQGSQSSQRSGHERK